MHYAWSLLHDYWCLNLSMCSNFTKWLKKLSLLMGKPKWNVFQISNVGHQEKVDHQCCKALWLVYGFNTKHSVFCPHSVFIIEAYYCSLWGTKPIYMYNVDCPILIFVQCCSYQKEKWEKAGNLPKSNGFLDTERVHWREK